MVLCTVLATILEGRQFLRKRGTYIFVEGKFYNELLSTERIEQTSRPLWDTELEWTLEHKTLHLLRTQKATVKLTCFSFSKEKNSVEEIGFIVLDLRQVQSPTSEPKPKWFSLVNVKKGQGQNGIRPELRILFQAGPKQEFSKAKIPTLPSAPMPTPERRPIETPISERIASKLLNINHYLAPANTVKPSSKITHEALAGDRFYRIGDGTVEYIFYFGITLWQNLFTRYRVSSASRFYFQFKLFDRDIITEKFSPSTDSSSWSPTRIFVNLRSSLHEIQEYFANCPLVAIYLYQESDARIMGCARVSISDLFQVASGEPHFFEGLYGIETVSGADRLDEPDEPYIGCSLSLIEKDILHPFVVNGGQPLDHYLITIHLVSISSNNTHLENAYLEYNYDWLNTKKTVYTEPSIEIPPNTEVFLPNSFYTMEFFSFPNRLLEKLLSTPLYIKLLGKYQESEEIRSLGIGIVDFNPLLQERNASLNTEARFSDSFNFTVPVIQQSTKSSVASLRVLLSISDVGFITNLSTPIGFTIPHREDMHLERVVPSRNDGQLDPLVISSQHSPSRRDEQTDIVHENLHRIPKPPLQSKGTTPDSHLAKDWNVEGERGHHPAVDPTKDSQMNALKEEIGNLKRHLQKSEKHIRELEQQCSKYSGMVKENQVHLEVSKQHSSQLQKEIEKLKHDRNHIQQQYERCKLEKRNYRNEWINATLEIAKWKLQNQLTSKETQWNFMNEEKEIRRAERKLLKHLKTELKSLKAKKSKPLASSNDVDPNIPFPNVQPPSPNSP
ncbi:hypothetical protein K7432_005020 [Basidiobolus ranarum]|uniref:C2 domain-containing protein n=1 Tax=Basidiobolus ranarum TaxID=34480 RepID=A0ABR2W3Q3_9FUNG